MNSRLCSGENGAYLKVDGARGLDGRTSGRLGISPFALEWAPNCPNWRAHQMLRQLAPITRAAVTVQSALQWEQEAEILGFDEMQVRVRFGAREASAPPGFALVIALGEQTFLLAGARCSLYFQDSDGQLWDFLWAEDGDLHGGQWRAARRLSGDDTWDGGVALPAELGVRRVKLFRLFRY